MARWGAVCDALVDEAATVHAGAVTCIPQGLVADLFPDLARPLCAALLAHADHPALPGGRITVPDHDMGVRIGLVLGSGLVVESREEGHSTAPGQLLDEGADQLDPLCLVELDRQRDLQLVDDTGVLAVGQLLGIEPGARCAALRSGSGLGDVPGDDGTAGGGTGDVSDMRPRSPGGMGGSANSAMRQVIDCHAPTLAKRPPRCKGGRTYGFCAKTRAVDQNGLQRLRRKMRGFEPAGHVHMHMPKAAAGGSIPRLASLMEGRCGRGSESDCG